MSFLTGRTTLANTSAIPTVDGGKRITKEAAVALLHDHDFFLRCEPHHVSHRVLPAEQVPDAYADAATAKRAYALPAGLEPVGTPPVKVYEVVDHVPNPVWSSSVVSKEEFVDFAEGLWVRIRSPLAIVMETKWTIRERKGDAEGNEEGALELVEDVDISCSKLLMAIVRAQVDNNWKGIHAKIVGRLVEDAKKGDGAEAEAEVEVDGKATADA